MEGFPVLHNKKVKGFENRDMIENVWEKIIENLDFVENRNFIKGNTKQQFAVVLVKIPSQIPMAECYYFKLHNLNLKLYYNKTLTRVPSYKIAFLQNTFGLLLLELVSENILKSSCCENISIYLVTMNIFYD